MGKLYTHADFESFATAKGGLVLTNHKAGYRYLNRENVSFRCSRGHEWQRAAAAFRYGKLPWCRKCNLLGEDYWDRTSYEKYAKEKRGELTVCPEGDIAQSTQLGFRCAQGHEWTCIAYSIKNQKSWCKKCLHDSLRGSIEEARKVAEERGGVLLSKSYRRNSQKLKWQCHYNHVFYSTFARIKAKGGWCPECASSLSERVVRIYFEHLFDKKFPKTRPQWLSDNGSYPLELDGYCEEMRLAFEHQGMQHYQPFGSITRTQVAAIQQRDAIKRRLCRKNGIRLVAIPQLHVLTALENLASTIERKCRRHGIIIDPRRLSEEIPVNRAYLGENEGQILVDLQAIALTHGGRLVDSIYAGRMSPLPFICQKGHAFSRSPREIFEGRWCPKCSPTARLNIALMQQWAKERNGACLSKRYVAARFKLKWSCNACVNHFKMSANSVQQGQWCPKCAIATNATRQRNTIDAIKVAVEGRGMELLSTEYSNAHTKLEWRCRKCSHEWPANYNKIQQGQGCPMCGRKNVWVTRRKNAKSRRS